MGPIAVSGASGKTGWRIVDEALQQGLRCERSWAELNIAARLAEAEQQGRYGRVQAGAQHR